MYQQEQRSDSGSQSQSYYAIVFGRDGNKSIRKVLDSLLAQTVMPARIMIIDDGSTDGMYQTVLEYEQKFPHIVHVRQTSNKTRDYTRLPLLWNMGILPDYDYHVIVPSDASFVPNYAERILLEFTRNPDLVVCSGDWGPMNAKAPHGGGRFVKQSFFFKHYPQGYPHILGYESEILERALMGKPGSIKVLNDLEIFHHDALGHSHNFKEFGYGMKCLGYYPPYAIFRIGWDFLTNKTVGKRGALKILRYYVLFRPADTGYYSKFPEDIRRQVRARQKKMLKKMLRQAVQKIWRQINKDRTGVETEK
ncbi:glycosyl transferase [Candidatus Nitrososphaera evergladensis SR1]|uniref:Glycosyl transferase n=1 Tax=Candidatus Nitrososphaera evergladensis SR1 TaxID=1459636 RepID=A0A075MPM8_9ARCH|nr:glycosyltransferase family A protein [Candidatus Nitrososphaera evergladensis]AIF82787.1 glycosyl transferase [Candidatus Nitrososphaera evergladensis SR1]